MQKKNYNIKPSHRDLAHQHISPNYPLELEGRLRRTYKNIPGSSEKNKHSENFFIKRRNNSQDRFKNNINLSFDSFRTIIPDKNADNSSRTTQKKHVTSPYMQKISSSPGNIQSLLDRTPNLEEELNSHKRKKSFRSNNSSVESTTRERRSSVKLLNVRHEKDLSPHFRFTDFEEDITMIPNQSSSSLCININNYNNNKHLTPPKLNKILYEYHSSIQHLPGALKERNQPNQKNEKMHINKHYPSNIFQDHLTINNKKFSSSKTSNTNAKFQANICSFRNGISINNKSTLMKYSKNTSIKDSNQKIRKNIFLDSFRD